MRKALLNIQYEPSKRNKNLYLTSMAINKIIRFKNITNLKENIIKTLKDCDKILNKKINFKPIYIDTNNGAKQVGYYANIFLELLDDNKKTFKKAYFGAWIEVNELVNIFNRKVA
ncbi:hypothetical protein [Campylobacter concisus]